VEVAEVDSVVVTVVVEEASVLAAAEEVELLEVDVVVSISVSESGLGGFGFGFVVGSSNNPSMKIAKSMADSSTPSSINPSKTDLQNFSLIFLCSFSVLGSTELLEKPSIETCSMVSPSTGSG